MLSDITIFEEESDEDYEIFIDDGQISDKESSENEDQDSGRKVLSATWPRVSDMA